MPTIYKTFPIFFLMIPTLMWAEIKSPQKNGWWNADRSSVGIAPKPQDEPQAMVQIYAARAYSWRGYFGVHTWVSVKEQNANQYTSYEVMGSEDSQGIPVIHSHNMDPDRKWYGSEPILIFEQRGPAAADMILHIEKAVSSYPYPNFYRMWPGPNSNTFVSYLIRSTPGMNVELPPNAIGKDWLGSGNLFGLSESKTGIQFSVLAVFGLTLGLNEGIEVNILGLAFGVDFLRPALKLPFVGRLGFSDQPKP